jgi:hypothetical protein
MSPLTTIRAFEAPRTTGVVDVRCPWCREQVPALGGGAACPHCGKPLESGEGEKVRPLDLDYERVLAEADASSWRWSVRGAAFALVTALVSLLPLAGGAIAYTVLVVGQFVWTGVLVARPYHRHFSPARRLVTRWVRRLGLLLVVLPAHAAAFAPPLSLVLAPAVFVGACVAVRAYCRFHLVREKERLPVTAAEKALLVVMAVVFVSGACVVGLLVYFGVVALGALGM